MKAVVPDIDLIKTSVDNLRFKSSGFLKQYNDIVWISDIINFKYKNFIEKYPKFSNFYKCILQYNQNNLDFIINRRHFLKDEINKIQKIELKKCIKELSIHIMLSIVLITYDCSLLIFQPIHEKNIGNL